MLMSAMLVATPIDQEIDAGGTVASASMRTRWARSRGAKWRWRRDQMVVGAWPVTSSRGGARRLTTARRTRKIRRGRSGPRGPLDHQDMVGIASELGEAQTSKDSFAEHGGRS